MPGPGSPTYADYLNETQNENFLFTPIHTHDVVRIISSFENKGAHISCYSVRVLKFISPLISPILKELINRSFIEMIFPKFCKIARVVPVFKSGLLTSVSNYRGISILPIFSKIFEKVVHKQLSAFFVSSDLLNPNQFGFRQNRSTTDAITDMTQYIYDNLDCGNIVISFFLDFCKAFDTVNHRILLDKLKSYGTRDMALNWFKSYLSGRLQYVSLDGFNSQLTSTLD